MKKILISVILIANFFLLLPASAAAKLPTSCKKGDGNQYTAKCFLDIMAEPIGYPPTTTVPSDPVAEIIGLVGTIFAYVLGLLGVLFVVLIIYSGILWMTAQGNEEKVKKANSILKDAVIGLFIVIAAALVMYLIVNLLLPVTSSAA